MAGRDGDKLAAVRDEIGAGAETPLVIADADNPDTLRDMVARAKVICSTVGPISFMALRWSQPALNLAQIMLTCPVSQACI